MSNIQGVTLTLYGAQDTVFLYTTEGDLNAAQKAANEQLGVCPEWDVNTLFSIDFQTYLAAGNIGANNQTIDGWNIYRQKGNEKTFVNTVSLSGSRRSFVDYSVVNNTKYQYYIYPSIGGSLMAPMVTDAKTTEFDCWTLYLTKTTADKGVYKLSKAFDFRLNFEAPTITNNTGANIITTFSQYQRVRKNTVNCLSGTLSSLIGYYDETKLTRETSSGRHYTSNAYVETISAADAMFSLSTNTEHRKFLRDLQGRLLEVEITGPITVQQQNYNGQIVSTVQVNWMEIADASNIIILNE